MYGDAWCPEDEQPHSDKRHAGSLPRGPQNPWGVPVSFKAHLTDITCHPLLSHCLQLHVESSTVPGDLHLTAADPRPSPIDLTSIHWNREDFSLTADHLLLESLWTQHTYFDGAFRRYCTVFIGSIVYYYCQVYDFSAILYLRFKLFFWWDIHRCSCKVIAFVIHWFC